MKSEFLRLAKSDWIKGLIMAILGAISGGVLSAIDAGTIFTSAVWISAAKIGGSAGFAYIIKNLFTNSQDQFAKPEIKKEE